MLEEMRIRGLGVIGDAVLPLGPGLTVVTGETGAGKTMVVTGLGLLLGARADAGAVRSGEPRAVVEGRVLVAPDGPVAERVRDAGADLDDDVLIIARTVSSEGRSRAHVGGRSVPVGLLGELASDLVAVHGQSDQQRLLQPARQREVLDRFAGEEVAQLLADYSDVHERWREVGRELDDVRTRGRERAQEADLLRHGLEEVAAVEPQPGEDAGLRAERERLEHADALRAAAAQAHTALLGDGESLDAADAASLVGAARQALDPVAGHDAELAALQLRVAEIGYLVSDVAGDLASYGAGIDADPARLAAVQDRTAALTALTRKYGADADEVLAWSEQAAARLALLDGDDDRVERLQAEQADLRARLGALADELSARRTSAADRLSAAVTEELASLAMKGARLQVAVSRRDEPGPTGQDDVELLLAPHAGGPPRPVGRGASGGELSRVMLALEVVLAGADPVPTFVFDEVDAGVGGRAAVEIGRRLARLARGAQVLCVTHLPQVAAYADRHLVVTKSADGAVTESDVVVLDEGARVAELARMLAGQEESATAQAHAEELLATAREDAAAPV